MSGLVDQTWPSCRMQADLMPPFPWSCCLCFNTVVVNEAVSLLLPGASGIGSPIDNLNCHDLLEHRGLRVQSLADQSGRTPSVSEHYTFVSKGCLPSPQRYPDWEFDALFEI